MRVTVAGAGIMGRGIAVAAAAAGWEVVLYDPFERALAAARDELPRRLERRKRVEPKIDPGELLERIVLRDDLRSALAEAGIVIEAVPEDLGLKRELFAEAVSLASPQTILASNTSSIPISEIAAGAPFGRERIIGMHFFNPAETMELVEIVVGAETGQGTVDRTEDLARQLGKTPIVVQDSPGFASSRLGVILGLEAVRMVEEQVADVGAIDKAMETGYRHPMGPLKLTDYIGLDTRLRIAEQLAEKLGDRFRPPELLRRLVEVNRLGRKTGAGFYDWSESRPRPATLDGIVRRSTDGDGGE